MEPEEPLMQGVLLLPPQGMLGQLKKSWHKRFCQLFRTSNYGIKRVEIYDSQEEAILQSHSPRIVTLDACIKIAPSNQSHVFKVVTKSGIHYFGCYSELEMTHWITAFQLVAFKDSVTNQIEENNDLYCTSGEGVFSVKVVETDASKRCGLETRNYTLVIAAVDMKLMDGDIVLFTWPYRYIRRYGYRDGKFIFEAGRKCESGEGSFRLEHGSQQEIFRCMYAKMKSMKKLLDEESNSNIDCNDTQFQAALSMEAGSRAALPPSSNNSSSNLIDIDFSTAQNSQKQLSSSTSMDSAISSSRSLNKSKPAKPPRKYVFANLLEKRNLDSPEFLDLPTCGEYRTISQGNSPELSHKSIGGVAREDEKHPYDLVEIRNDAWKTHGIDSVHHTERINSNLPGERDKENDNDDLQYEIMMPARNHDSFQNSYKSKCGVADNAIVVVPSGIQSKTDESDYDKLEHFGSATKLSQKPTYKYTNSTQSVHSNVSHGESSSLINPTWSNYEIVDDMSAIRLADDSHLGYGIIRKKPDLSETTSTGNTAVGPQHKVFNNSEYAIVSKPKRV
ncbi:PREDICTED: docking protein 3 [Vollenhovia emeryi]|uniref:docking protein 3 n=1 Tax=Vollenhovia emeryi TaxID=411798 RepID=UPI0005F37134|nr:PREDICTED: docking protein 3 [Vollenhovia emeryi]